MASEHHPAAGRLFAENAQSHLLKLPGELRNRIYEYALTPEAISRSTETYTPRRPSLLQVCRQLRYEARLMYFDLTRFHIIVTVNNIDEVRRWAAALTDEELRSISSLTIQVRVKYGRLTHAMLDRQYYTIVDFYKIVGGLKQRCNKGNITDVRDRAFAPYLIGSSVWN